jgi:hypothetical protein
MMVLASFSDLRVALLGEMTTANNKCPSSSQKYLDLLQESAFMDPDGTLNGEEAAAFYPQIPLLHRTSQHRIKDPVASTIYRMITALTDQINLATNSGLAGKPYELCHALWEVMVRQLILLKPRETAFPRDRPYEDHYKIPSDGNFTVAPPQLLYLPDCHRAAAFHKLLAQQQNESNAVDQTQVSDNPEKTVNLHKALEAVGSGGKSVILRFGGTFPGIDLLIFDPAPIPGGVKITGLQCKCTEQHGENSSISGTILQNSADNFSKVLFGPMKVSASFTFGPFKTLTKASVQWVALCHHATAACPPPFKTITLDKENLKIMYGKTFWHLFDSFLPSASSASSSSSTTS